MDYKECDQIAADIISVQTAIEKETGVPVSLDLQTVEQMVESVERMYATGTFEDFEEILEATLGGYEMRHAVEYTAYKRLLRVIFGRRSRWQQEQARERGKEAPFAPF